MLVVTDDNPRTEDPAAIRAAVLAGAQDADGRAEVLEVGDRREAIRRAVTMARPGDTVVVAGKGHETGQEIEGTVHPFDDRDEVRAAIEAARMIPLTLGEIADVVGGEVVDGDPDLVVTGPAFLDSRSPEPGGLFVAFVGERVDGHEYAAASGRGGRGRRCWPRGRPVSRAWWCATPEAALQALAHEVLRRRRRRRRSDHGRRDHRLLGQDQRQGHARRRCWPTRRRRSRPPAPSTTSWACR